MNPQSRLYRPPARIALRRTGTMFVSMRGVAPTEQRRTR